MSDSLPSPFTVSSMEELGYQFASGSIDPGPPPSSYTLGNLLADLQAFGESYRGQMDAARQKHPAVRQHDQIQLAVTVSEARASLRRIPGFDALRTFTLATWGEEIALATCRRIVGELVRKSSGALSAVAAEAMQLNDAADVLNGIQRVPFEVAWQLGAVPRQPAPLTTLDFLLPLGQMPIARADCLIVPGDTPSACPNADPPIPAEYLPDVLGVFQRFKGPARLLSPGQTIHWVGRSAWRRNACKCYSQAVDTPAATPGQGEGSNGKSTQPAKRSVRPKRSTEPNEARSKIIAALTAHHQYANGSCLNTEAIGVNELARKAEVGKATVSEFFAEKFQGHGRYRAVCRDATRLVGSLKLLNDEFAPHHLYGRTPRGENDGDADE